jgi:hypothetical protein
MVIVIIMVIDIVVVGVNGIGGMATNSIHESCKRSKPIAVDDETLL